MGSSTGSDSLCSSNSPVESRLDSWGSPDLVFSWAVVVLRILVVDVWVRRDSCAAAVVQARNVVRPP